MGRPDVSNPVVLTGDIHSNWANELVLDFDDLGSESVATEFVGTSISSGGNGVDKRDDHAALLSENPFVKFQNSQRGYVACRHARTRDAAVLPISPLSSLLFCGINQIKPQCVRVDRRPRSVTALCPCQRVFSIFQRAPLRHTKASYIIHNTKFIG